MKRLFLAAAASLALLGLAMPAAAQLSPMTATTQTPFLNMTTATTTKIVTGTANKITYITHLRFIANGTTTFKLVTGTGTNCNTGTADLTETWDLQARDGAAFAGGLGPVVVAAAGLDICAVNSQAVNLRIGIAAAQF